MTKKFIYHDIRWAKVSKLLSLCMIVKNEENVIERCLDSVKDYVDEIIIIDTGSTDRTVEIVRRYTGHVYDFQWVNDFSAARNASIAHATSPWILILDADEYMLAEDLKDLRDFLVSEPPREDTYYSLPIISYLGDSIQKSNMNESFVPRLFRNHMNMKFERPIHEQIVSAAGLQMRSVHLRQRVYHTGYLAETLEKKDKSSRNLSILLDMKRTKTFSAYDYFVLGNEYSVLGDSAKAIYNYRRAIRRPVEAIWYTHCLFSLAHEEMKAGHIREAWDLLENHLSRWGNYPEYHTFKGVILFNLGFFEQAGDCFQSALQISEARSQENQSFWIMVPELGSTVPYQYLLKIALIKQDIGQLVYILTKNLILNKLDAKSLLSLMDVITAKGSVTELIDILNKVYPDNTNTMTRNLLAKTALLGGHLEAAELFDINNEKQSLFNKGELLRYAILKNDRDHYRRTIQTLENDEALDGKVVKHRLLASVIWPDSFPATQLALPEDHSYYLYWKSILEMLKKSDIEISVDLQIYTCDMLTELFTLRHYETFDEMLNKVVNQPKIINHVANFFYIKHMDNLSLQYHSYLSELNALDTASCEHLAYQFINQNECEEGLFFLEQAIELSSERPHYYILYCLHCSDPELSKKMMQRFVSMFPQYRRLPMIEHLIRSTQSA